MLRFPLFLGAVSVLAAAPGRAQDRLWVTGTLTYHRLWHDAPPGGIHHGSSYRIMGRLGFRPFADLVIGFAAGSWQRLTTSGGGGPDDRSRYVAAVAETQVPQLYLQYYPLSPRWGWFVRLGVGRARSDTFEDDWQVWSYNALVALGTGGDIPLVRNVYLTPSVDLSRLLGAGDEDDGRLIRRAVAVGVGLTLR